MAVWLHFHPVPVILIVQRICARVSRPFCGDFWTRPSLVPRGEDIPMMLPLPIRNRRLSVRVTWGFHVILWTAGLSLSASPALGQVSSWGWRTSLGRSGLKAKSVKASASTPNSSYTNPPSNVPEPKATTQYLAALTQRRALNPARFDKNHATLGPLLGEEARLKAGDCSNIKTFNGLLPNNPYYNYERWVRSLNPTGFDKKNPNLGAMLAEDQRVRTLIANCPAQQTLVPAATGTPRGITAEGNVSGGTGGIAAVPEPASLALVLIGTGVLIARRLTPGLRRSTGVDMQIPA